MKQREFLGSFEEHVLLALVRLGPRAYGYLIWEELLARTEREVALGAVYATLKRMEKKGFVRSAMGESNEDRNGRRKKYFRLTGLGENVLVRAFEQRRRLCEGIDALVGVLPGIA